MQKRLTAPLAGVFALSLVLGLGACGGDDPEPSPATQAVALVCPEPIGAIEVQTDPDDQWAPGYAQTGQVFEPVAFGEITFTDTATGATDTQPASTKPGADTAGAVDCTFTLEIPENPEAPQGGTATGTVTVVEHGSDWTYTPVPDPSESATP